MLDAGSECVYIFNADNLRLAEINDSFSALVYCSHALLGRNSPLGLYGDRLMESCKEPSCKATNASLTHREKMVIKALCSVSNPKHLASELNISEKTVSTHKIRGLQKLGVKNTIKLYSVLLAWDAAFPEICPEATSCNNPFV